MDYDYRKFNFKFNKFNIDKFNINLNLIAILKMNYKNLYFYFAKLSS